MATWDCGIVDIDVEGGTLRFHVDPKLLTLKIKIGSCGITDLTYAILTLLSLVYKLVFIPTRFSKLKSRVNPSTVPRDS